MRALWLVDANGCYGRTLREFRVHMEMGEAWDGAGLVDFVSGLGLTGLTLDIPFGICLSDETLENLGRVIPSLEEFHINDAGNSIPTLWGVFALLRNCQKMRSLSMDFDALVDKSHLIDMALHNLPKSSLAELDVRWSNITNATIVGELFSEVLPHLGSLTWADDEGVFDDWEERNSIKWKYVWDFQQSYKRMHEQLHREYSGRYA
jgi:hypothetical protein